VKTAVVAILIAVLEESSFNLIFLPVLCRTLVPYSFFGLTGPKVLPTIFVMSYLALCMGKPKWESREDSSESGVDHHG
jgi:hypothetical protein